MNDDEMQLTEKEKPNGKERFWFVASVVMAVGVVVPPGIGLLGTVFGMTSAFGKLGDAEDPKDLAGDISVALWTTMGGVVVALICIVGLVISLICYARATRTSSKQSHGR